MNIGVIGCGTIASWASDFIAQMNDENIVRYAAASRDPAKTRIFAEQFGWQKACESQEELLADPAVDLVYICLPNQLHHSVCLQALRAGKNVVCEKPFAVHDVQAAQMLTLAEEKGLFISEALWPAFLPSRKLIDEAIASGAIGDVTGGEMVSLSNVMFMDRVKRLETGGGALLDMGPYMLGRVTDGTLWNMPSNCPARMTANLYICQWTANFLTPFTATCKTPMKRTSWML